MACTKPIPTSRSNLLITPRRRYYVKRFSSLLRTNANADDDAVALGECEFVK